MMKYAGAGVSFLILILMIVSMITTEKMGFWILDKDFLKASIGFSGTAMDFNGDKSSKFVFDIDEPDNASDDMKTCLSATKAAFVLMIVGMIFFVIAIAGYVGPPMAGGMVPLGGGAAGGVLVVLNLILMATACKDDTLFGDAAKMELGIQFYLMVVAAVLSMVNCGLGFMAMGEIACESGEGGGGVVQAKVEETEMPGAAAPASAEGDGCNDEAPEGGVYMKNGVWYDKDDNPIQQ